MKVSALLVALAVPAVLAAPAHGAVRYEGKTSQGRVVSLKTDDSGLPVRIWIGWRAPCGDGMRVRTSTVFRPPFDHRTRRRVRDEDDYRFRDGPFRFKVHTRIGARKVSGDTWRGFFGASVVVRKDGRAIDSCRTGAIRWQARR